MMIVMLLLPLAGALLAPLMGKISRSAREAALRLITLGELALAVWLFAQVWQGEERAFALPQVCGMGLTFRADGFRALYAVLACFMWALASQLSLQYFAHHTANGGRYACCTLITLCGVVGVFLSDDLYTAFVFFEIMSMAS